MTTVATFREIAEQALQNRREVYPEEQTLITVGAATCGRAAGAAEVIEALKAEVVKQGLNVPIVEVGCLGHCYAEPMLTISKPGYPPICYGYVNPVIAERLVKEFV